MIRRSSYDVWFDNMLLPITPSAITYKINSKNETVSLINDGEINVLKPPGLSEISFDFIAPSIIYPWAKSSWNARTIINQLARFKARLKPFPLRIIRMVPIGERAIDEGGNYNMYTRAAIQDELKRAEMSAADNSIHQDTLYTLFDQNLQVSLEDYTIKEDASNTGTDFTVSVNLKTYRDYGSKVVMFSTDHKTATVTKHRSYDPPLTRFDVTTLQGDTLGSISKVYYGTDKYWLNILAENNPPLDGYTTISTPLQGGITLSMPAYDATDGNPYNDDSPYNRGELVLDGFTNERRYLAGSASAINIRNIRFSSAGGIHS